MRSFEIEVFLLNIFLNQTCILATFDDVLTILVRFENRIAFVLSQDKALDANILC